MGRDLRGVQGSVSNGAASTTGIRCRRAARFEPVAARAPIIGRQWCCSISSRSRGWWPPSDDPLRSSAPRSSSTSPAIPAALSPRSGDDARPRRARDRVADPGWCGPAAHHRRVEGGGALARARWSPGNLCDRIFRSPGVLRGHVVDFVRVGSFPSFNVADSAITIGAILLIVRAAGSPRPRSDAEPGAVSDDGSWWRRRVAGRGARDPHRRARRLRVLALLTGWSRSEVRALVDRAAVTVDGRVVARRPPRGRAARSCGPARPRSPPSPRPATCPCRSWSCTRTTTSWSSTSRPASSSTPVPAIATARS